GITFLLEWNHNPDVERFTCEDERRQLGWLDRADEHRLRRSNVIAERSINQNWRHTALQF
ncbi:MAG TPA: hypothetical protein VGD41_16710, partial [Pyrinomonadaceae bacterium]